MVDNFFGSNLLESTIGAEVNAVLIDTNDCDEDDDDGNDVDDDDEEEKPVDFPGTMCRARLQCGS